MVTTVVHAWAMYVEMTSLHRKCAWQGDKAIAQRGDIELLSLGNRKWLNKDLRGIITRYHFNEKNADLKVLKGTV